MTCYATESLRNSHAQTKNARREGCWIEELNSIDEGGNWIEAGKRIIPMIF